MIYLVPSAALAVWISSTFLTLTTLTEFLAVTGLIASIFALFFSMVNFDVLIIREILRGKVKKKPHMDKLQDSIPTFNILLQSWQVSEEPKSESEWLNRWVDNCVADAVASYPVRYRSWYWRLSLSSSLAIGILLLTSLVSILWNLQQNFLIPTHANGVSILQLILFVGILAGFFLPWVANWWRDYWKNKDFTRDIRFVAEFQYLQHLVGLDYIKRPVYYEETSNLLSLKLELERLQLFLYRGDWSIFVRSWDYLRQGLIDDVEERINSLYYHDLLLLWTEVIDQTWKIHSKRRLELLLRIASHKSPTGIAGEIIHLISENGVLKDPSKVDLVKFFTSDRVNEHKEMGTRIRSYYGVHFHTYLNNRHMTLHNRLNALSVKLS